MALPSADTTHSSPHSLPVQSTPTLSTRRIALVRCASFRVVLARHVRMLLCWVRAVRTPPFRHGFLHRDPIDFKRIEITALCFAMGVARMNERPVPLFLVRRGTVHDRVKITQIRIHFNNFFGVARFRVFRTRCPATRIGAIPIGRGQLLWKARHQFAGVNALRLPTVQGTVQWKRVAFCVGVGVLREIALPLVFGGERSDAIRVQTLRGIGQFKNVFHLYRVHFFSFDRGVLQKETTDGGGFELGQLRGPFEF